VVWADALPNLLIGLREGLEAGLVVSILLAAVYRFAARPDAQADRAVRVSTAPVWLGVGAAVVLALSFGAVPTFYRSVLSTTGQEALGGALSVVAVGLVTGMIFWMRGTARTLSAESDAPAVATRACTTRLRDQRGRDRARCPSRWPSRCRGRAPARHPRSTSSGRATG
jgi:FTR1 family protein